MFGRAPEPSGLVLRPPEHGELSALAVLYERSFARFGSPGELQTRGLVVAELDGQLVGLGRTEPVDEALAGLVQALRTGRRRFRRLAPLAALPVVRRGDYMLTALAVDPRHRGKGIGRALAEARIEAVEVAGAHHLFVHCAHGAGTHELYAALGFVGLGEAPFWYPSGHGMTLMALALPRP